MMEYIGVVAIAVLIGLMYYKKRCKPKEPDTPTSDTPEPEVPIIKQDIPAAETVVIAGYIVKDRIKREGTIKYMPQGLQVFDENGCCILDITETLCRFIGSRTIKAEETTGSIDTGPGTPYLAITNIDNYLVISDLNIENESPAYSPLPAFTIKPGLITWKHYRPLGQRCTVTILYGVM